MSEEKKRGSNKGFDREKNHFALGEESVKMRSKKSRKYSVWQRKYSYQGISQPGSRWWGQTAPGQSVDSPSCSEGGKTPRPAPCQTPTCAGRHRTWKKWFYLWIHRQELQGYITSMPDCYPNFILLHHQQIQSKHVFSFLNRFLWTQNKLLISTGLNPNSQNTHL